MSRVRTLVRSSSAVRLTSAISRSNAACDILLQDLHIGCGEHRLDVVGCGVGRSQRVGPVRRCALQERDLTHRAFGLGVIGLASRIA